MPSQPAGSQPAGRRRQIGHPYEVWSAIDWRASQSQQRATSSDRSDKIWGNRFAAAVDQLVLTPYAVGRDRSFEDIVDLGGIVGACRRVAFGMTGWHRPARAISPAATACVPRSDSGANVRLQRSAEAIAALDPAPAGLIIASPAIRAARSSSLRISRGAINRLA